MFDRLRSLSSVRIMTYVLFFFSLGMLGVTSAMAFNSLDVISEWELTLPGKEYRIGDKVSLQSVYTKVREAGGESIRYIECKNKDGVYIRTELNRRQANRQSGKGGTGIDVVIPDTITHLPTTCKFSVAICYDTIFPWYCHPESKETTEFTLSPASAASAASGTTPSPSANQTPAPTEVSVVQSDTSSSTSTVSSSQTTTTTTPSQSNTSQESEVEQKPVSQPTRIQRILAPVTGLFGEG